MTPSPISKSLKIAVRADASVSIGGGHVMRCLALGKKLRDAGAQISFFSHELIPVLAMAIKAESNFELYWLKAFEEIPRDPSGDKYDFLIVDHYRLDEKWEARAREFSRKILVIDDLDNRNHDCDFLLDQNYFPVPARYDSHVPAKCLKLLGPKYALLREEFSLLRPQGVGPVSRLTRILVFMGSTDPGNEISKVVRALLESPLGEFEIGIISGSANPHLSELKQLAALHSHIQLWVDVGDMAQKTLGFDLAIAAGGSANWERLCLGIPTITISTSSCETEINEFLGRDGYVKYLGTSKNVDSASIRSAVHELVSTDLRQNYKKRGQELVDGAGVTRVMERLLAGA